MVCYKSYRIVDGKPRWIIEDENGNINKSPTKEQLKNAVLEDPPKICCKCKNRKTYIDNSGNERWYNHICDKENCTKSLCYTCGSENYRRSIGIPSRSAIRISHDNTICCQCGDNNTLIKSNGRPLWIRYVGDDFKKKWDGRSYICTTCYSELRNNIKGSYNDWIRSNSKIRSGKLSKYSEMGEGTIIEFVVMKIRKTKNTNIEFDTFKAKFDLVDDPEYGKVQVKGPSKDSRNRWDLIFGMEHMFNTLFVLCMSRDRKNVEMIYIIPESELYGESRIQIYEDPNKISRHKWVEKFKMNEDIIEIYNEVYKDLILYLKDKEFFGIEDLNNWLKGE